MLEGLDEEVEPALVLQSVKEIDSLNKLKKITGILRSNESAVDKLEKIDNVSQIEVNVEESKSKMLSEFQEEDVTNIVDVFGYPCSKEELIVISAFSGRGKTTTLLSMLKQFMVEGGLRCQYIAIADWSESLLKERIDTCNDFPTNFYAACYSDCSLAQIEMEVESVDPDIVFADYLQVITPDNPFDAYRHQLRETAKVLKNIAQRQNVLMVTAHQLGHDVEFPTASDLAEAKLGIIQHADLVIGLGRNRTYTPDGRNVTTIKVRRHAVKPTTVIQLDFTEFEMMEIG